MRRTRRDDFLVGKLIYVVTGILVIILLVLILGTVFGKDDKTSRKSEVKTESGNNIESIKKALQKDNTAELTELIQQYYTAMSASDITTLEQIMSTVSDEDKDIIRRKKDYIESYNNIKVYSKLCNVDDSYLVFAAYDIKFKNEATMVPGLETFYVKKAKTGNLYIYKGDEIETKVEDFINEQIVSDEVQALVDDVNERYVDALASSATLLEFVEGFEGDTALIEKAKAKAAQNAATATESTDISAEATQTQASEATSEVTQEAVATETPVATEVVQATETRETVLVTANVNLRNGNDESADRLVTMIVGDQATRISITDNGWSKVQYNGMEGYVKSDYVTTFKITSDSVKPTTTVNVRYEASETANMAGQVTPDTTLTRYAVCDNGWSQVKFNGGVGYVKTEYLSE